MRKVFSPHVACCLCLMAYTVLAQEPLQAKSQSIKGRLRHHRKLQAKEEEDSSQSTATTTITGEVVGFVSGLWGETASFLSSALGRADGECDDDAQIDDDDAPVPTALVPVPTAPVPAPVPAPTTGVLSPTNQPIPQTPTQTPVTPPPTAAPTMATVQCNGAGFSPVLCPTGSGCVFHTHELSICLEGFDNVALNCVTDDFEQCGGQGFAACQNCKAGSECVTMTEYRSICQPEDYDDAVANPVIPNNGLALAASFVAGVDPELDSLVADLENQSATTEDGGLTEEIRRRLSEAYGTEKGLEVLQQKLDGNDQGFINFEQQSRAKLQVPLCDQLNFAGSQVSEHVRDCICGLTSDPFVYCSALLEKELNRFVARRRRERERHRLLDGIEIADTSKRTSDASAIVDAGTDANYNNTSRGLECRVDGGLEGFVGDLTDLSNAGTGSQAGCLGGSCSFPIPKAPFLMIQFGAEVCIPSTGLTLGDISSKPSLELRRNLANSFYLQFVAELCFTYDPESQQVVDFLDFLGIDLCMLQIRGSVKPFMGLLEASAIARGLVHSITAKVTYLAFDDNRNALALCPAGEINCASGKASDCGLCEGDSTVDVFVGLDFLFLQFAFRLGGTNEVTECADYASGGQCTDGIADCLPDNTVCGVGTTCNNCCNTAYNYGGTQCGGTCLPDGEICGLGTTCNLCCNGSVSPGVCGTCLPDNAVCGAGTTCNNCCNTAYNALGTQCGGSCLADGTNCGLGTTCNLCCNGSVSPGVCGTCLPDNTVCGVGTTCNNCCNTAYNAVGTQCGGSCLADGTICGLGTTCNLCCNGSVSPGVCGTCLPDNMLCGAGTTCNNCCHGAYNALGTQCGGSCLADGTICGLGTTCNLCCNGSVSPGVCGTCLPDNTVCGVGTTCNNCCNTAYNALGTQCGGTCWPSGTFCALGTTCNFCCNGTFLSFCA